jgi:hypothetical protein
MAKRKPQFDPENGSEVVDYATGKDGVTIHQKKKGMTVIKTEQGSMQVYDNKTPYSEPDKANVRRWLRRLGLLAIGAGIVLYFYIQHVLEIRAGM